MTESNAGGRAQLLVEIGTEDLPPASLKELSEMFAQGVAAELQRTGFSDHDPHAVPAFCTPRRLAVIVDDVLDALPDRRVVRKGPPLAQARGADGGYTAAAVGFAKSCGVAVDQLQVSEQEPCVFCEVTETGERLEDRLPETLRRVAASLPMKRVMRWGDRPDEFVRPVRWLCVVHGSRALRCELFGVSAANASRLHRSCGVGPAEISSAEVYERTLESGKVMADFEKRRAAIADGLRGSASGAVADDADFDRVASMVEWPRFVGAGFEARFLELPEEAVIHVLQHALGAFAVRGTDGRLLPEFWVVVDLDSTDPDAVRAGYERVARARLADLEFFFQRDREKPLSAHCGALDDMVFHKRLGTMSDKVSRLGSLAHGLAETFGADAAVLSRAAELCKCDLTTEVVTEYPELRGTAGRHYARADGEPQAVAEAIEEHHLPRRGGEMPPPPLSAAGTALSLADKMDTLTGFFSIGLGPTSSKDPFALRRAAFGIIEISAGRAVSLHLRPLIRAGLSLHHAADAAAREDELMEFFRERLKFHCLDRAYAPNCVNAVLAVWDDDPHDAIVRLDAVNDFWDKTGETAAALAALSKRVRNILRKADADRDGGMPANGFAEIAEQVLEPAERNLYEAVSRCGKEMDEKLAPVQRRQDVTTTDAYLGAMYGIAGLHEPTAQFFEDVMVMSEDRAERRRRLALLNRLNSLFLRIADFSKLHVAAPGKG